MQTLWKMTPIYVIVVTSLMTSEVAVQDAPKPELTNNLAASKYGSNSFLKRILRDVDEETVERHDLDRRSYDSEGESSGDYSNEDDYDSESDSEEISGRRGGGGGGRGGGGKKGGGKKGGGCTSKDFCTERKKDNLCHYIYAVKYCNKTCQGCSGCVDEDPCPHWKKRGWCDSSSGGYPAMKSYCRSSCPGLC